MKAYNRYEWTTKDKRKVRIVDMTDEHLKNTLSFCIRKVGASRCVQSFIFRAMRMEAINRDLWDEVIGYPEVNDRMDTAPYMEELRKRDYPTKKEKLKRAAQALSERVLNRHTEPDFLEDLDIYGPIYDSDDLPFSVNPSAYYPLLGVYGVDHPQYKGRK